MRRALAAAAFAAACVGAPETGIATFLGWERDDAGSITAIRYWSSQPWTRGIGVAVTDVRAATDAFDPSRIHVARAACPP